MFGKENAKLQTNQLSDTKCENKTKHKTNRLTNMNGYY